MQNDESSIHLQQVNEEIYKRNVELAIVNNTLSLLKKLYQISLSESSLKVLASSISEAVKDGLKTELVAIYKFDSQTQNLTLAGVSNIKVEQKDDHFAKLELSYSIDTKLEVFDSKLKASLLNNLPITDGNLLLVWDKDKFAKLHSYLSENFTIKSAMFFPLYAQGKPKGLLIFALNRSYDSLNSFEQNALASIPSVVAVALDKAVIYEELQSANIKLQALDKARAEFISIASHQLRTPPATIKWYASSILAGDFGKITQEAFSALERIQVTNNAQISTIDDLLNASRIERGKLEFFFEKCALSSVVKDLVDQLQPLAAMKKLSIAYEPSRDALPELVIDKEKIRQVINNMIDNAIKYSKVGSITVSEKNISGFVEIWVKDNGKGIAPELASSLFEKYTRGSDSATHATGLGLGLYVAKIIIEQHGGKIWAESDGVGKGSVFKFSLPVISSIKPTTIDLAEG